MQETAAYIRSMLPGDPSNDRRVEVQRSKIKAWAEKHDQEVVVFEDAGPAARLYMQVNGEPTGLSRLTEQLRAGQVKTLLLHDISSVGRSVQFAAGFFRELVTSKVKVILLGSPDEGLEELPAIGLEVDLAALLPGLDAAGHIESALNMDRERSRSRPRRRRLLFGASPDVSPCDEMSYCELLAAAHEAVWLARRSLRRLTCARGEEHDQYLSADALSALQFIIPEQADLCPGPVCMVAFALREVEVYVERMGSRIHAGPGMADGGGGSSGPTLAEYGTGDPDRPA